jgi:glutamyl-tRNA synthetase
VVSDLVHGEVTFDRATLDDWILVRSDGTPTYNFCVVVDDVTMKITHVIRGNDHLSNTPKQILCYEALGYPLPVFAHIPMILGPDRKRLSKRHGATSVLAFRDEGFLAEAMVNYFARLGWAHGDQEVFTRDELIRLFDLRQVGATPAIFDRTKLEWLNQVWMKRLAEDPAGRKRLAESLSVHLRGADIENPPMLLVESAVVNLTTRATTLAQIVPKARFYFEDPKEYDPTALGKLATPALGPRLDRLLARLAGLEPWTATELEGAARQLASELGVKLVDLAQPIRLALTGETASPPIFGIMADLGRETTLRRLRRFQDRAPRA